MPFSARFPEATWAHSQESYQRRCWPRVSPRYWARMRFRLPIRAAEATVRAAVFLAPEGCLLAAAQRLTEGSQPTGVTSVPVARSFEEAARIPVAWLQPAAACKHRWHERYRRNQQYGRREGVHRWNNDYRRRAHHGWQQSVNRGYGRHRHRRRTRHRRKQGNRWHVEYRRKQSNRWQPE